MSKQSDDAPIQKLLKVGKATVGLMGLDVALSEAMAKKLPENGAVDFLFSVVKKQNYIPPGLELAYRNALRDEYVRLLHKKEDHGENMLVIRILGPGCVSCNRIYTMSIDILQKFNIPADIESVKELDEVWRHGVTTTPALIINGELKSAGRLPTPVELENWIRDAAEI